jgi:GT2 family glycosyltransferase
MAMETAAPTREADAAPEPGRSDRPCTHVLRGSEYVIFGDPDLEKLHGLIDGPGDLWHSGPSRGRSGLLSELKYWQPCFWWYLNDIDAHAGGVSWRVDAGAFVVRRSVWDLLGGFDPAFASSAARALDFGFRLLRAGGVPLHVPGLYPPVPQPDAPAALPRQDLYLFFVRHFKREYRLYMLIRETLRRRAPRAEWRVLRQAESRAAAIPAPRCMPVPPRPLRPLPSPAPKVSVILPTMGRQRYAAALLEDLAAQTLPPFEVFVIDATPPPAREDGIYAAAASRLPLRVIWQSSLGSCRARNHAIRLCTGDYVLFSDDDIRIPPGCIENHVRLLETYGAAAANGLDIRADHHHQTLDDLSRKLLHWGGRGEKVGVDEKFNNANSCVRREWVEKCIGNDVNFDGGYGEDRDFGLRLVRSGGIVLFNPYSANLHLKPPAGGFRWWGRQAGAFMRNKTRAPWDINRRAPVIRPRPSPTILYGFRKHYTPEQLREWFFHYLLRCWWPRFLRPDESPWKRAALLLPRVLKSPLTVARIWVSYRIAGGLLRRGPLYH